MHAHLVMWWWPSVRIELTAKGGQACNVRVHRVMSRMEYEGFTTRHERHEREWVKTSDVITTLATLSTLNTLVTLLTLSKLALSSTCALICHAPSISQSFYVHIANSVMKSNLDTNLSAHRRYSVLHLQNTVTHLQDRESSNRYNNLSKICIESLICTLNMRSSDQIIW